MARNRRKEKEAVRYDVTLLTDHDIYLFKQGNHFNLYHKLGSHLLTVDGIHGTYVALWAPNAERVTVMGNLFQVVSYWVVVTFPKASRAWYGSE